MTKSRDGDAGLSVAHETVGRIRLSSPLLRRRALAAAVEEALLADARLTSASVRRMTGSLVLRFAPHVDRETAMAAATKALARARSRVAALRAAPPPTPRPIGSTPRATIHHAGTLEELLSALGSDPQTGLSAAEALARLGRHGPNLAPREAPPSRARLATRQVSSLPVAMLGASATISLATGGIADAVATLSIVAINGVLGYVTEAQAERTIQSLIGDARATVGVLRDGKPRNVPAVDLVPGDVVELNGGMQAAADARLLSAHALTVDEAALTGESEPVNKAADADLATDIPISGRTNMVHAGTIVVGGSGRAVVVATGASTEAAQVQAMTQGARRPASPLEAELDDLGARLAKLALLGCVAVFVAGRLRGYPLGVLLRDSLALAVAAVPEGLPMVATTTMSLGLRRMKRRGILIRQLSAVESLGAVETVCLDKTGTLTQNRMAVVAGAVGLRETDLSDAGAARRFGAVAACAILNNDAVEDSDGASGTEAALLDFARRMGRDPHGLALRRPRTGLVERAPGRPWMATEHAGRGPRLYVKGAPEAVLGLCDRWRQGSRTRPLEAAERASILRLNDRLASRPARVLGFAQGDCAADPAAIHGLVWLGMLALEDPVRHDAPGFVRELRAAGIEPVLITGDQGATALAVAEALDLGGGSGIRVIDAGELTRTPPELLAGLARDAQVFARVSPQQKLHIVRALQDADRVVAMTGDGVNDGPALKAAEIGIAMGATGADLAREVANVVIRDDRLATLVDAIAQGRVIHRNIRRSVEFLVTTNLSEILVGLAEAVRGPAELETPLELLWINLATDVFPGLGLALADPDPEVMRRPPRGRREPIIPGEHFRRVALDSGLIAASSLGAHLHGIARYGRGPETRAITFAALSLGQLVYTLVSQRSDPRNLRFDRLLANHKLDAALAGSIAMAVAPHLSPALRRLLGIAPLAPSDYALAGAAALAPSAAVLMRQGAKPTFPEEIVAS